MRQFDLFDASSPLESAFQDFHEANPGVYRLFDRFTRQLLTRGVSRYSADAILHRIRWETAITTGDEFKINNNFSAYYARLWLRNNPEHSGFFVLRSLRAETATDEAA